jgi:hypothetical protein
MSTRDCSTTSHVATAAQRARRVRDRTSARDSAQVDHATFAPGEYGRMSRADGTEQWWVRSASGNWIALTHQRVMENEDGTITLLYLK